MWRKDTREKLREGGAKNVSPKVLIGRRTGFFRKRKTAVKTCYISVFDSQDTVEGLSEKKINAARLTLWVR